MAEYFFISDLHGSVERYKKLFNKILQEKPRAVFAGGDLFPHAMAWAAQNKNHQSFSRDFLLPEFRNLKKQMQKDYPKVFVILGNDDEAAEELAMLKGQKQQLWEYIHNHKTHLQKYTVYGYAHVPPTPFQLKDWERYDVSRYVDPGCISPEEGRRTIAVEEHLIRYATIAKELKILTDNQTDFSGSIFLFHSPPYKTKLDRAALDGKSVSHAPLDVNVGSIAIQRFIKEQQPFLTLHGHVHESPRLTGSWRDKIGNTHLFSAAHDGPELALVSFDPENLDKASRRLL